MALILEPHHQISQIVGSSIPVYVTAAFESAWHKNYQNSASGKNSFTSNSFLINTLVIVPMFYSPTGQFDL